MARQQGNLPFSSNFETRFAEPLDARSRVELKSDLTDSATWERDGNPAYTYVGMLVSVYADPDPTKNGLYRLKAADYSDIGNWVSAVPSGAVFPGGETITTEITNDDTKIPTAGAVYRALGAVIASSRIEVVQSSIAEGYVFSLEEGVEGVYTLTGAAGISLGETLEAFQLDNKVQLYLNGTLLDKETEVMWESSVSFSLMFITDAGDRIITRRFS